MRQLPSKDHLNLFGFEDVCSLISKTVGVQHQPSQLLLTLQLDEFSHLDKKLLDIMLSVIGKYVTTKHQLHICVLPLLTGTDSRTGIQALQLSGLIPASILLQPLSKTEQHLLMKKNLNDPRFRNIFSESLFLQTVDSLGGIPRFIQFFLDMLNHVDKQEAEILNFQDFLRRVMDAVICMIDGAYNIAVWNSILGHTSSGVRQLLLWALACHPVQLGDMLNGVSVEQARSIGLLMLEEVTDTEKAENNSPSEEDEEKLTQEMTAEEVLASFTESSVRLADEGKYYLNVPLIMLRTLNRKLALIEDRFLDPVQFFDFNAFEEAMVALRILRQNLLCDLQKTTATFGELYPHAIGHPDDLNHEIPIKKLTTYHLKSVAWQKSLHDFEPTSIPILESELKQLNLSQGGAAIFNAPRAPSYDAMITHPPQDIEGMQFKSSAVVSVGGGIPKHHELVITKQTNKGAEDEGSGTVCREFQKANDTNFHAKIFPNFRFTLAVISNKPLSGFPNIDQLPRGVILVAHQNFKK